MSVQDSSIDTEVKAKCTTFNFTVPSVFWIWVMIIITIAAVIFNYFLTFKVGALTNILPK